MKNFIHFAGPAGSPAVWVVLLLQGLGEGLALARCRVAEAWQDRPRLRHP